MYIVLHIQLSVLKSNPSYMCNEDLKFGLCKRVCYIRVTVKKYSRFLNFFFNFNKGDGAVLTRLIFLFFFRGGGVGVATSLRYKKRLLLICIHHFDSDVINNMDHMRILRSILLVHRVEYLCCIKPGIG